MIYVIFVMILILDQNTVNFEAENDFFYNLLTTCSHYREGGCPRGVMVKAMDCLVSESVLLSRYYVHFRANTLGKGMNPLILPAMG